MHTQVKAPHNLCAVLWSGAMQLHVRSQSIAKGYQLTGGKTLVFQHIVSLQAVQHWCRSITHKLTFSDLEQLRKDVPPYRVPPLHQLRLRR